VFNHLTLSGIENLCDVKRLAVAQQKAEKYKQRSVHMTIKSTYKDSKNGQKEC
jgi:hypothetical protein